MKALFYSKDERGFTLIELLVVISIIGILMSILYFSFEEARQNSREKVSESALKEVELAYEVYRAQNGSYPNSVSLLVPEFIAAIPTVPGCTLDFTVGDMSYECP